MSPISSVRQQLLEVQRLGKEGQYKEAFQLCKALEESNPNNPDVYFYKGAAYFKAGDLDRARQEWERVLEIDPGSSKAKAYLAKTAKPAAPAPAPAPPPLPPPPRAAEPTPSFGADPDDLFALPSGAGASVPSGEPIARKKTAASRLDHNCFGARFVALILDNIFIFVVSSIAGYFLSAFTGIVFPWIYFAFMESREEKATLGKKIMGLSVTDVDGGRISFLRATGRYFGKILSAIPFGIGFLMAAFTQRHQGLHDLLAGTLVIRTGQARKGLAFGIIAVFVLLCGAAVVFASAFILSLFMGAAPPGSTFTQPPSSSEMNIPQPGSDTGAEGFSGGVEQGDSTGQDFDFDRGDFPTFEIQDRGDHYLAVGKNIENPDLDSVEVTLEEGMVYFSGTHQGGESTFSYGTSVETPVDVSQAKAEMSGNVLEITIPKID